MITTNNPITCWAEKMSRYLYISIFSLLIGACAQDQSTTISYWILESNHTTNIDLTMSEQLKRIENADPENDAILAFKRNDFRFFGTVGFTLVTPGVDSKRTEEIKIITWTSDMMENDQHVKLNKVARMYAEQYNERMRDLKSESTK